MNVFPNPGDYVNNFNFTLNNETAFADFIGPDLEPVDVDCDDCDDCDCDCDCDVGDGVQDVPTEPVGDDGNRPATDGNFDLPNSDIDLSDEKENITLDTEQ